MRRLPVYLLIDTSGSMRGEPIEAVNNGLQTMVAALRRDPHALESVHLSVITYDREARVVCELTPLATFNPRPIATPDSGPTHLGEALALLIERVPREVRRAAGEGRAGGVAETGESAGAGKGDWAPLLFVMTDGKPSDTSVFEQASADIGRVGFANIVGCAAGPKAERAALERFCDHVASLDTMDSGGFARFFLWVSEAITADRRARGTGDAGAALPPPPDEIRLAF